MKIVQVHKFTATGEDFEGQFEILSSLGNSLRVELTVHDNEPSYVKPNGNFYAVKTEDEIDRICAAAKMILRSIPKKED